MIVNPRIHRRPVAPAAALSPLQVAGILSISRSNVYVLIHSGELPSIRFGASVRVPVDLLKKQFPDLAERIEMVAQGGR